MRAVATPARSNAEVPPNGEDPAAEQASTYPSGVPYVARCARQAPFNPAQPASSAKLRKLRNRQDPGASVSVLGT